MEKDKGVLYDIRVYDTIHLIPDYSVVSLRLSIWMRLQKTVGRYRAFFRIEFFNV